MAKAPISLDYLPPVKSDSEASPSDLYKYASMLQRIYKNLVNIVNFHIGFGDGTHSDNIDGVWVSMNSGAGNVNVTLTHNLGRIPVGYIPMTKTAACDIYTGSVNPTTSQITLRGSVGGVTINLFVF